jgi:hypothetical protein
MSPYDELNLHIEQIGAFVRASEDWTDQYRQDDKSFKKLVQSERKIDTIMRGYFKDLSTRLVQNVDWSRFETLKAADFKVDVSIDWEKEQGNIFDLTIDQLIALEVVGASAGEALYGYEAGISTSTQRVLDAARAQAADLSKTVTETSIRNVRTIIEVALRDGMDQEATSSWLQDYINNPVRADMIARTEAVNAYSRGLQAYGDESGAESKTWASLPTCSDLEKCVAGETVPINDLFSNKLLGPAAHVYCRCGLILNYPAGG